MESSSIKEERIRKITHVYYSRPEIQKAILDFSTNREICPRYFEGFGKRPDSLQYASDIFELVKRGATSFHASEEIWSNPLLIKTGMSEKELNNLRTGWDLLIDIDCKWFDYSKLAAKAVVKVLNDNGIKNVGIKFSGSKGFHIIVPWKAFPKEINGEETKNLFPKIPRVLINYLRFYSEKELKQNLPDDFFEKFKDADIKKGIKCNRCQEIATEYEFAEFFCNFCKIGQQKKIPVGSKEEFKCPSCRKNLVKKNSLIIYECSKCGINSKNSPNNFSQTIQADLFELMGLDLILVSPRHLFRMPYSLHEKTALASVVIDKNKISDFDMKDADPLKIQIKDFIPECKEGEASRLVLQALDWNRENNSEPEKKNFEYKPIQVTDRSEKNFPPCIKKILEGVADGKKRSVFALINFFRSIGIEKDELEKILFSWNEKNKPPLQYSYIKLQIAWALKRKPLLPPNCREFYQGIGVCFPDELCKLIKNPVNYVVRKNFQQNRKSPKNKDNFKNNN
ncbi:MAG: DNA primase small subunit domain-containing protein [Candidatus Pacearchaeota archaeon]